MRECPKCSYPDGYKLVQTFPGGIWIVGCPHCTRDKNLIPDIKAGVVVVTNAQAASKLRSRPYVRTSPDEINE